MILTIQQEKLFEKSSQTIISMHSNMSEYAIRELETLIDLNKSIEEEGIIEYKKYTQYDVESEILRIQSVIANPILDSKLNEIHRRLSFSFEEKDYQNLMLELIRLELAFGIPITLENYMIFEVLFDTIYMEVVNKHFSDRYKVFERQKVKTLNPTK